MKKIVALLLGAAFLSGAAVAGPASDNTNAQGRSGTYYWLHPKLGMVKVDRATNAMVVARRDQAKTQAQAGQATR